MIDTYGVEHIELEPGSVVVWHSNAWHYSPPNASAKGRIAIAGVMSSPAIVENGRSGDKIGYKWMMKDGKVDAPRSRPRVRYEAAKLQRWRHCPGRSSARQALTGAAVESRTISCDGR